MNMNMKKIFCIASAGLMAFFSACSGYLDVNPKGETFDADMFNSADGYEDAIYGIYSELSSGTNLYGGLLLWIPEAMSGNVTAVSSYQYGNLAEADWTSKGPVSLLKKVWSDSYEVINNLNNIIKHAEEDGDSRFKYSRLYHGEALALRALIHFDLVRLYGNPFWASSSLKSEAIPYVKKYSFDITSFSSLDEVYADIIEDLKTAEFLMGEDESLVPAARTNSAGSFTDARITHMNIYAVEALLARVYWSMGDLSNAAIYATKVIESGKFSMRPVSSFVQFEGGTLDLNETIFGFYSTNCMHSNAVQYNLSSSSMSSFSLADDWRSLYEEGTSTGSDYRMTSWFDESANTLIKTVNLTVANGGTYSGKSIVGINILRIPEMYYILSEYNLTTNPALAAEYFNTVTKSRGLDGIQSGRLTLEDIYTERRKEFYGEGFTWHEQKKEGRDRTTAGGNMLSGSVPGNYTLPIPYEEYEARNNVEG